MDDEPVFCRGARCPVGIVETRGYLDHPYLQLPHHRGPRPQFVEHVGERSRGGVETVEGEQVARDTVAEPFPARVRRMHLHEVTVCLPPRHVRGGYEWIMSDDTTDPYLWLEDVTGEEQLDWVRARNDRTVEEYTRTESFTDLESRIREILDTDARIPYARRRGEYLYNYWRDAEHVRGLWRRTTMEQYLRDEPEWDVLVDLDAVAEEEGENWVWSGAQVLRPDQTRALISLSRGGADASVIREFDLVERRFVSCPDSFELPEAKTDIGWIDADTVYVGSNFGEGSLTDSGYPRLAKKWRRGTPIEAAETVFEGERTDVAVSVWYDNTPGYERSFVDRAIDFYRAQRFELTADGELVELDVPDDARVSVYRDHLLVRTRSEWLGHPAGTLLAANYPAFLAGSREVTVLFAPDEHTSLEQYAWTQNHLLVVTLRDVQTRVRCSRRARTVGRTRSCPASPMPRRPRSSTSIRSTATTSSSTPAVSRSPRLCCRGRSAARWRRSSRPRRSSTPRHHRRAVLRDVRRRHAGALFRGRQRHRNSVAHTAVRIRRVRELDGAGLQRRRRAGVAREGLHLRHREHPRWRRVRTTWHTQALKENRHKVFEDFAAVAKDLVARGITTAEQLGTQGGSNGGLLMGVMLTRYPELFGRSCARCRCST